LVAGGLGFTRKSTKGTKLGLERISELGRFLKEVIMELVL